MNSGKSLKAHISLGLATIIFGVNYWISKGLMPDYVNPQQLVLMRVVGASLLFWVLSLFLPREKVSETDMKMIAIAALSGITVNQLLFFIGLDLSTPVDVAIIHVSNPVFVIVIAALMIKERITRVKIVGIALGASGAVLLITYRGDISFTSDTFTGNLMALLNTLAYAFYLVLIKPVMNRYSAITVMKWAFLFGTLFSIPLTLSSAINISFEEYTRYTWFALFFVIVVTTFMAYLFTIYALKYVDAGVVSYYIYLQPIMVTLIAFVIGSQLFAWQHAMAAALIFFGVYLVSKKRKL